MFALAAVTIKSAKRQTKRAQASRYYYRWLFYINMILPSPSIKIFPTEGNASRWNNLKLYLLSVIEPLAPFFLFYQLIYSTASTFPARLALFFAGLAPFLIGCLTHMATKTIWYIICFPLSYPVELYRCSEELDGDQLLMATLVWAIGTSLIVGAIFWLWPIITGMTALTFIAGLTLALIHGAPYLTFAVKIFLDICIGTPPVILISSLLLNLVDTIFYSDDVNYQINKQVGEASLTMVCEGEGTVSLGVEAESNSLQKTTLILADDETVLTKQTFDDIQRTLSGRDIDIEYSAHTLTKTQSMLWNHTLTRDIEPTAGKTNHKNEISSFSQLSIN